MHHRCITRNAKRKADHALCTLLHRCYGEMTVTVDDSVRVSHSRSEGHICYVSLRFIESGELSFRPPDWQRADSSLPASLFLIMPLPWRSALSVWTECPILCRSAC